MAFFLYIYGLGAAGLIGPDEPRYASIAREMARSGDWITPRLWGSPWFEKPALLYWMAGVGYRLGLGPEWAPRLPVALASVAFLAFFWWILWREFGCRAAWFGTLILGTCVAWIGFSEACVTDLPMTAAFSAAMLLALPWIAKGDARLLPASGAMLGLAVLAKGLVPVALAAPLVLGLRSARRDSWPRIAGAAAAFFAVSLPWYLLCYARNGRAFLDEFFWKHHFERFSGAAIHPQPWYFYLPVLLGLLAPWTPALPYLAQRPLYRDRRLAFLLAWLLFGLVFFSAAENKLAGYLLPLLPAAAALAGIALDRAPRARWALLFCAAALIVFPIGATYLPVALAEGMSRAPRPAFHWTWLLPLVLAAVAWALETRGRRFIAVFAIAAGAAAGTAYLKTAAAPDLDRIASARTLWNQVAARAAEACVDEVDRNLRYGLNYYSVTPLPDCSEAPRPVRIGRSVDRRASGSVISPFRD
jgi:4-amino-4-deoxy-L-arabinose transferase-like glycosyltransferase